MTSVKCGVESVSVWVVGPSQSQSVSGVNVFMCVLERASLKECFNNICVCARVHGAAGQY